MSFFLRASQRGLARTDTDACGSGPASQVRTKLARTGHSSTVAGRFLVIIGGIIRDGSPTTHVLLVSMDTLGVSMCGPPTWLTPRSSCQLVVAPSGWLGASCPPMHPLACE